MLDRLDLLELRQAGARDTMQRFAGGVGHEMQVKGFLHAERGARGKCLWTTGAYRPASYSVPAFRDARAMPRRFGAQGGLRSRGPGTNRRSSIHPRGSRDFFPANHNGPSGGFRRFQQSPRNPQPVRSQPSNGHILGAGRQCPEFPQDHQHQPPPFLKKECYERGKEIGGLPANQPWQRRPRTWRRHRASRFKARRCCACWAVKRSSRRRSG